MFFATLPSSLRVVTSTRADLSTLGDSFEGGIGGFFFSKSSWLSSVFTADSLTKKSNLKSMPYSHKTPFTDSNSSLSFFLTASTTSTGYSYFTSIWRIVLPSWILTESTTSCFQYSLCVLTGISGWSL